MWNRDHFKIELNKTTDVCVWIIKSRCDIFWNILAIPGVRNDGGKCVWELLWDK